MQLTIISGRSGSGKSTVLHVLEDHGYYYIDNLPASLLPALANRISADGNDLPLVAVSIDARNVSEDLEKVLKYPAGKDPDNNANFISGRQQPDIVAQV